uniref:Ig-like domain-containing protein n=1 Tax=Macrostomum lignano TaxID=282301 RepID=A0A1I8FI35_9PLAT
MSRQLLQHLLLSCLSLSLLPTCQAAATAPAGAHPSYEWPRDATRPASHRPMPPSAPDPTLSSSKSSSRPAAPRGALRPPWKSRRDATFSVKKPRRCLFNMTTADEGSYKCLALTLDGPSAGGRVQLLTAMTPAEPRLFVNGKQTLPMVRRRARLRGRIELVEGQAIMIRCNANVGKPPGSLSLLDLGRRAHLKGAVRTWTGPVTPGSKTMTVYSSVTHSVKIELGSHGAVYGCQLKPHPMFAHLNITYGVRRIELQPYRDNYFHGDRIDCLAKGRPAPKNPRQEFEAPGRCSPVPKSVTMRTRVRRLTESGVIITGCCSPSASTSTTGPLRPPGPPQRRSRQRRSAVPGVPTKVKHWVRSHHRGISVFLITFGVICGFALIAVVFAYLTAYGRLRDNPEDRLRFYGDNGRGNGGAYCDTSDEEEGSVSQPLNKAKDTSWIGT